MKLLIIGDLESVFIENFGKALNAFDKTIQIDLFSPSPLKEVTFGKHFNRIFSYLPVNPVIAKIPKLRGILTKRSLNKTIRSVNENISQYNVILIHGLWLTNCYIFSKLNTKNIFTVGAIWGSDFYKRGKWEEKIFETIDKCDIIVISMEEMVKDVLKFKQIERNKIRNCLFGLAPLHQLFELQKVPAKQSKEKLGFLENDFIILCGYNGSPNNQHLQLLSILKDIEVDLPRQSKLIIPLTYGGSREYKTQVKEALKASGITHVVYENFLSDEEVAHLRKATDLMIQVPITDAFSGSMQEHLFAQNIMIAGSWLPYKALKEKGVYYETIDCMSELKEKLLYVFNNLPEIKDKVIKSNIADKFKSSLWSECIIDWHRVINEYKSKEYES